MKVELWSITPDAEMLIEKAGRVCWRTSLGDSDFFIRHLIEKGHLSVLEHAEATFFITGISRVCSHQLVRHRFLSPSQESQRFVDMSSPEFVVPPSIAENSEARCVWECLATNAALTYETLRSHGIPKEDARTVLFGIVATRVAATMNFRELRHVISVRCDEHAQWEIREVAMRMLELVYKEAPSVFQDLYDIYKGGSRKAG